MNCLLLLCLLAIGLHNAAAIKCYSCVDCPIPWNPKGIESKDKCSYCMSVQTKINDMVKHVAKSCTNTCVESDTLMNGNGLLTECCKTDLCNKGHQRTFGPLLLILTGTAAVLSLW
ncbi:hypothetical protein CRM22_010287 [Opisthorchis felineus]|uniref:Snake toxin/toxin-like domain-containing protein n=1 Tax=Opisthorchis felineus TaxID=147828 RepID=A0A4S2L018_OPIFE|nr:hypothetical protein CRM22_010287 [Opisthorchis felineus]